MMLLIGVRAASWGLSSISQGLADDVPKSGEKSAQRPMLGDVVTLRQGLISQAKFSSKEFRTISKTKPPPRPEDGLVLKNRRPPPSICKNFWSSPAYHLYRMAPVPAYVDESEAKSPSNLASSVRPLARRSSAPAEV